MIGKYQKTTVSSCKDYCVHKSVVNARIWQEFMYTVVKLYMPGNYKLCKQSNLLQYVIAYLSLKYLPPGDYLRYFGLLCQFHTHRLTCLWPRVNAGCRGLLYIECCEMDYVRAKPFKCFSNVMFIT